MSQQPPPPAYGYGQPQPQPQTSSDAIVALVLDLQNVISIRDVYASLPYPEGYAAGDFFA